MSSNNRVCNILINKNIWKTYHNRCKNMPWRKGVKVGSLVKTGRDGD